nr:hypothetical protein [Tanacetum cinerariifolium]
MAKLAFCDYHNMMAILEKTEHNTDFHQIVDFLEASHIRYALTVHPTVYVSHIRQFWSTARIETTDRETKILTKVNGRQRTVTESPIRRHRKVNDEEDETAFSTGDVRYGEAFPTVTHLDAGICSEGCSKHEGEGMDQEEDLLVGDTMKDSDKSADKGSDSTYEMANVLGTLGATNILASGGLSKEKVLEQMSVQLARDLEAKFAQEDQIIREQADRDSKIARIHAERELEMMIAELDRSNEMVAKYLSEYEQAEAGLSHDKKVELIDELLMYSKAPCNISHFQVIPDII